MVDIKEKQQELAQKYNLKIADIDESLIPLFLIFEQIKEDEKIVAKQFYEKGNEQLEKISTALSEKITPIYCDNPSTALIVGIGKYGSIIGGICLAVSVIFYSVAWRLNVKDEYDAIKYYKEVSKFIKVKDDSTFFISEKYLIRDSKAKGYYLPTKAQNNKNLRNKGNERQKK